VKSIVILLLTFTLVGCAPYRPYSQFYRPGDPCIRRGERFEQLPNFQYEAIARKERGEVW
jgi:hypothetical protein